MMWITLSSKNIYFFLVEIPIFLPHNLRHKGGGNDMVILSTSDMFDVKVSSLLADYDRDTITNLYQPIIGYTALAVYFSLWSESSNQKVVSLSNHEQLLLRMRMSTGEYLKARKVLEAVGLIKTRLEKVKEFSIYHYELFAPKTPMMFFNDTLLYGLLIQNLGEAEANRIKRVYQTSEIKEQGEDISSSFNDVFHPDFENAAFMKAAQEETHALGRRKNKIDTEFSYEKFFNYLKEISQITDNCLTKKEVKEIERLSTLYGVSEEVVAEKVANVYDLNKTKGQRVDLIQLNKDLVNEVEYGARTVGKRKTSRNIVIGEEGLAAKIKFFEVTNPRQVLKVLQNGTKPAQADLNILHSLAEDYKLTNAVINVVIDFVLQMNNNVLSKYSVEKIASSISRENIETAIDAMDYLNKNYTGGKKSNGSSKKYTKKSDIVKSEESKASTEEVSEEEIDALLEEFKDR